jgi:hypothetical protein
MKRSALDYERIARSFFAISSEGEGVILYDATSHTARAARFTASTWCILRRRSGPGMR